MELGDQPFSALFSPSFAASVYYTPPPPDFILLGANVGI